MWRKQNKKKHVERKKKEAKRTKTKKVPDESRSTAAADQALQAIEEGAVSKRSAKGGSKQCGRDVVGGGAEAGKKRKDVDVDGCGTGAGGGPRGGHLFGGVTFHPLMMLKNCTLPKQTGFFQFLDFS